MVDSYRSISHGLNGIVIPAMTLKDTTFQRIGRVDIHCGVSGVVYYDRLDEAVEGVWLGLGRP